jgi:cell fate (sporulation/competence/biofilm development) regulator YlbF (YheA/YmcA/DUF963 family)
MVLLAHGNPRRTRTQQFMHTHTEDTVVLQKTKELCQTILDRPEVQTLRKKIETFLADDAVRGQYDVLVAKGDLLQQKRHAGMNLEEAEINEFEKLREAFLKNTVARGFLDAQDEMQQIQQTVVRYVSKTFELGRVPEASDIESGCCGGGGEHSCGCSH